MTAPPPQPRGEYETWTGLLGLSVVLTLVVYLPPLDGLLEATEGLHHLQHVLGFGLGLVTGRTAYGLLRALAIHGSGGGQRTARTLLATQRHYNPGGIPALLFAGALVALWHVPAFFTLAVLNATVHVLEHLSFSLAGGAVGASVVQMSKWTRLGALLVAELTMLLLAVILIVFRVHAYRVYPLEDEVLFGIAMVYGMMPLMLYTVYRFLVEQVS